MPASPQDTGGLGLLQLLLQHGVPPQALLSLLMPGLQTQMSQPQQQQEQPPRDSPGETPNIPDNPDPSSFGFGGASLGNIGQAALSGALGGGALGQAATAAGLPSTVGNIAGKAIGTGAQMLGVPSAVPSVINSLIGALAKVAQQTLDLTGKQVAPMRLGGPITVPKETAPWSGFNRSDLGPLGDPSNPGGGPSGPSSSAPSVSMDIGLAPAAVDTQTDPTYGTEGIMSALAEAISAAIAAEAEGEAGDATGPAGDSGVGPGVGGNPGGEAGDM